MASVTVKKPYKEAPLPADCPPKESAPAPDGIFLRLVPNNSPTAEDFRCGKSEGKKKPSKCDECTWHGCSFWLETTPHEKLADYAKLPNLSHKKFIAHVEVGPSSGRIKPHEKDPQHLCFWMYASFQPEKAIKKIDPI